MIDRDVAKIISEMSQEAGFYKGLLEGLLMQCKKGERHHYMDSDVFYAVKQKLEVTKCRNL